MDFVATVLSEAQALFYEAQAMAPQANMPFAQLDTLTPSLLATGGSAADLVGVQGFGSSSVMDDMALAAVWLAAATGKALTQHWGVASACHGRVQVPATKPSDGFVSE
jgi:hypothetical protein